MTSPEFAGEQLRVIRALMERATIYRALSTPTALVAGLLSVAGFGIAWWAAPLSNGAFIALWLVILALASVANIFFLWRGAKQRSEPFFSGGMKLALRSLAPAFILAGVMTVKIQEPMIVAFIWITLYGLALLATQQFAPRSLQLLGLAFLVTGCTLILGVEYVADWLTTGDEDSPSTAAVSGLMAATFGGYHLVYALAVWLQTRRDADPAGAEHV